MSKQRGRLRRALLNNRAIHVAVLGALLGAPSPLLFRTHHNARHRAVELLTCMARAAATNRTLAAAAARLRRVPGRHPTPEWFRDCLSRARPGQAKAVLAASAAARPVPGRRRHARHRPLGRAPGVCLVRSRERDGTQYFERVMTAQCVVAGARIMLALSPMGALDDIPGTLRRIIETVLSLEAHNAWAVACAEAQAGSIDGWPSQAMFRLTLVRAATDSMGHEPPPPVWP